MRSIEIPEAAFDAALRKANGQSSALIIKGAVAAAAPLIVAAAESEISRLHTWSGLMSLLDEHYPASIFTGMSEDPGPQIVKLIREIHQLRSNAVRRS
jgi:hypothetical protein